jgi:hypothetical protein
MMNPNDPLNTGANTPPQSTGEVVQLLQQQIQALVQRVDTLTHAQNLLQNKVIQLEGYLGWAQPQPSPNVATYSAPASGATDHPDLWNSLVIQYNDHPAYYEPYALPVSETPASIDRRRKNGDSRQVTLGPASNPNYWVIKLSEESGYWLVPKANLKVTGASFDTLQALFQVQGQPSHRLTLLKPAAVQMGSNQDWELVSQGEIQFL